jgi:hypothetical protein
MRPWLDREVTRWRRRSRGGSNWAAIGEPVADVAEFAGEGGAGFGVVGLGLGGEGEGAGAVVAGERAGEGEAGAGEVGGVAVLAEREGSLEQGPGVVGAVVVDGELAEAGEGIGEGGVVLAEGDLKIVRARV